MARRPSGLRIDNPAWVLVQLLCSYWGITDADGGALGATLLCGDLVNQPDFDGNHVVIIDGAYGGQARDISGITTAGVVTPASNFGDVILAGTTFAILPIRTTPAEVAALTALVNAIEAKLDVPANFMADVTALATAAALTAHNTALGTHDTDIKTDLATIIGYIDTEIGAIITALGNVALEASLGTHDTDIKALLATIDDYLDTEIAAIITSQGRQLHRMVKWSAGKVQVQITAAGATVGLPTITIENLPDGAVVEEAHLMFKFRMIENKYEGVNNLSGGTVALNSQVFQIQDDGGGDWADGINLVDDFFTLASLAREGGDVLVGEPNVGVANVVDENDTYNVRLFLGKADFDFINFDDCQVGLDILYSV